MQVSLPWLQELVDYKLSPGQLAEKLSLTTIGVKDQTEDTLELDLTYNRGDLLSMRGLAVEVAAITGSNITFDMAHPKKFPWDKKIAKVNTKVDDTQACPIYCIAKIEGLKVAPSSTNWVKKLAESGMRSVNNIADITNLIMLEYGQPMHAFDASKVTDETLVVRRAKPGEELVTLDDKKRKLSSEDLLITDGEKALGIAGVMGGKDSEVSDSTTTILLEAAIFDPVSNRNSSKRHGLASEASKRFQHGLTKINLIKALSEAIKMYEGFGGKLTGISLTGDLNQPKRVLILNEEKLNSLLGINIKPEFIDESLSRLQFKHQNLNNGQWEIEPNPSRLDINIEEDVIEEVARMYGYEEIPAKELKGELPEKIDQSLYDFIYDLKVALKNAGLTEVQTYSFYSTQVLGALGFNQENQDSLVRVVNPISSETEYMRAHIWPNLVEVAAKNLRQGFNDIAIFELGKVYQPKEGDLPKEPYRLAIVLMNGSDNPIQELVSIVEHLQETVHLPGEATGVTTDSHLGGGSKVEGAKLNHPPGGFGLEVEKGGLMKELETLFHPIRFATVNLGDKVIGGLAEVHPRFLNHFGIDKRVAILEIDLEPLI